MIFKVVFQPKPFYDSKILSIQTGMSFSPVVAWVLEIKGKILDGDFVRPVVLLVFPHTEKHRQLMMGALY